MKNLRRLMTIGLIAVGALGVLATTTEAQDEVTPPPTSVDTSVEPPPPEDGVIGIAAEVASVGVVVCVSPLRSPANHQPSEASPCASGETLISSNPLLLEAGGEDQYVVIRFVAGWTRVNVADADVARVQLLVGENVIASLSSDELDGRSDAIVVPISSIDAYPNASRVTLQVRFGDGRTATRYFRGWNGGSFYGFGGTNAGFWFPIGLFATSFRSGPDGLQFSAFPVGIAWGAKVYLPGSPFYFGFSAMFNWSIVSGTPQTDAMAMLTDTGVTLASFSVGAVIDIGNYFYVGGAATFDFRTGRELASPMLVVGIAPGLLQLLQAPSN